MTDKGTPYIDDVKTHLHETASVAVLQFVTGGETTELAISQAMLMKLIGNLGLLNAEWEKMRRLIDPQAGKAGDTTAMTATRPYSVNSAAIPGTDEAAIIFDTAQGPQAFAIPKDALVEVAQKLLREAEREVRKPPLSS